MEKQFKILRKKIDNIDDNIVALLLKRFKVVRKLGKLKKKQNLKIVNKNREKEILLRIKNKAKNKKEQDYLSGIFSSIISNSRKLQR